MGLIRMGAIGAVCVLAWVMGVHKVMDPRFCAEARSWIFASGKTGFEAASSAVNSAGEAIARNRVAPTHEPTAAEMTNALLATMAVDAAEARKKSAEGQQRMQEAFAALAKAQAKQTEAMLAIPQSMDSHFTKMASDLAAMRQRAESQEAQKAALDKAVAELILKAAEQRSQQGPASDGTNR